MMTFLKSHYGSIIYSVLLAAMLAYSGYCMTLFLDGWRLGVLLTILALHWTFATAGVFKDSFARARVRPFDFSTYTYKASYGDTEPEKKTQQEKPHGDVTSFSVYRTLPHGGYRYIGNTPAAADDEDR